MSEGFIKASSSMPENEGTKSLFLFIQDQTESTRISWPNSRTQLISGETFNSDMPGIIEKHLSELPDLSDIRLTYTNEYSEEYIWVFTQDGLKSFHHPTDELLPQVISAYEVLNNGSSDVWLGEISKDSIESYKEEVTSKGEHKFLEVLFDFDAQTDLSELIYPEGFNDPDSSSFQLDNKKYAYWMKISNSKKKTSEELIEFIWNQEQKGTLYSFEYINSTGKYRLIKFDDNGIQLLLDSRSISKVDLYYLDALTTEKYGRVDWSHFSLLSKRHFQMLIESEPKKIMKELLNLREQERLKAIKEKNKLITQTPNKVVSLLSDVEFYTNTRQIAPEVKNKLETDLQLMGMIKRTKPKNSFPGGYNRIDAPEKYKEAALYLIKHITLFNDYKTYFYDVEEGDAIVITMN